MSGSVVNTRLAVRKHHGGEQGLEFPFTLRTVRAGARRGRRPHHHEGSRLAACWSGWGGPGAAEADPWAEARRQDQKTA